MKFLLQIILLCMFIFVSCVSSNYETNPVPAVSNELSSEEIIPLLIDQENWKKSSVDFLDLKLLSKDDFYDREWESKWILEGPGHVKSTHGKLSLHSVLADDFIRAYEAGDFEWIPENMQAYFHSLEQVAQSHFGLGVKEYYEKGKFRGGHIVLWNKCKSSDNYLIEFDLKHHSPMGLFILFFSADGRNGKDLFSQDLMPRNGIFSQYVRGDNQSYHISTYTPHRGSANLRLNPGGNLLKSEEDIASLHSGKVMKYRLFKWGDHFQYYLNDELQMDYTDKEALQAGYVGLRLMAGAKVDVQKFRLYELTKIPLVSNKNRFMLIKSHCN
ncbi:DUF1961 family protein [Lentisphaera marina]|uniref:DUF1961 family protein n=1 Tax=Lentisphaera marina TaxID=1111041 RepID=UPI0023659137|nr:DUF1961 family protein [Lentisphaera marina]MDD7987451.1 DUF1961 family protein [Lentisphaera marina]